MKKYKWWDVYETLPEGWKIDNLTGSPLHKHAFCTDGKSPIYGGKRALVRVAKDEPQEQCTVRELTDEPDSKP